MEKCGNRMYHITLGVYNVCPIEQYIKFQFPRLKNLFESMEL